MRSGIFQAEDDGMGEATTAKSAKACVRMDYMRSAGDENLKALADNDFRGVITVNALNKPAMGADGTVLARVRSR
jgi:hypothetical protein